MLQQSAGALTPVPLVTVMVNVLQVLGVSLAWLLPLTAVAVTTYAVAVLPDSESV